MRRGRGRAKSEPIAVVDIGSNSGRVIVYRPEVGGHLQLLAGSRAPLRLARDLDRTGRIQPQGLERAFEALADFRAIARGSGARKIIAAGTSALRDAQNGPAFMRRVRRELGIRIRVLSGVEEARYGFLGAVGGLGIEHGLVFDLGGGSLQLARFRGRKMLGAASLPLGALRVSDIFLKSDPPTPRELRKLREHARETLSEAGIAPLGEGERLIGTGGTLRNLAKVEQRRTGYPIARLHGYVLSRRHVREITATLAARRQKKRARVPGLNEDRRDSVVGGGVVIGALMEAVDAGEIVVSGQGVREGLAMSLASETLASPEAARAASLLALARRFEGWSEPRARRREAVAAELLRALEPFSDAEVGEALLQAARILDIGRTVDFFDRHDHVADLVLAIDLAGFSHRQVALLSAVLRRAGDEDAPARPLFPLVSRDDGRAIDRAATVLALADEITGRTAPEAPLRIDCRRRRREVVVSVPGLTSFRPRGLSGRFERTFGRRLRVVAGPRRRY